MKGVNIATLNIKILDFADDLYILGKNIERIKKQL